jgi:sec-independent protein translocase protein TatC
MSPSDQPETHDRPELGIMSFGEHLEELRTRLFRALIVPLPLAVGFFFIAPEIRAILIAPLFAALRASGQTMQVQALSPAETITTDMKLSVIAALAVSAPWLLYQLWKFVAPGLYAHERRYVHFLTPLSGVLTACGMALFYWVLLPFTLLFLVSFGAARARTVPEPKVAAVTALDGTASAESSGAVSAGAGDAIKNATGENATREGKTGEQATREQSPALSTAPRISFPVLDEDPIAPQPGQAWLSAKDQVLRIAVPVREVGTNPVIDLANDVSRAVSGDGGPAEPQLAILELPLTVVGGIAQIYRLSEYVNFTLILLAGSVIAFQMPLVVLLLGWVGIVNPTFLREKRRWAIFLMAIVAALVTPPDVTSMLLLLLPMWLLYEFGILLLVLVPAHRVSQGRVFSLRRVPREPSESVGESGGDSGGESGSGWGGSSR